MIEVQGLFFAKNAEKKAKAKFFFFFCLENTLKCVF